MNQTVAQETWVRFDGRVIERDREWILEDVLGGCSISVASADARLAGPFAEVRVGSQARILKRPAVAGWPPASLPLPLGDCPCRKTCCIGLVLICCNGRVLGRGLGIWDECPRGSEHSNAVAQHSDAHRAESQLK